MSIFTVIISLKVTETRDRSNKKRHLPLKYARNKAKVNSLY